MTRIFLAVARPALFERLDRNGDGVIERGELPEVLKDASPFHHVEKGRDTPPFLICFSRGMRAKADAGRGERAEAFAEKLRAAGVEAAVVDASDRNHGEINAWFGRKDDAKVTGAAVEFLEGVLEGEKE